MLYIWPFLNVQASRSDTVLDWEFSSSCKGVILQGCSDFFAVPVNRINHNFFASHMTMALPVLSVNLFVAPRDICSIVLDYQYKFTKAEIVNC